MTQPTQPQPPSHVVLELETEDIKKDVAAILSSMRQTRNEAIRENGFEDTVRDEYLHLALRLGSIIQKSEEPWVLKRINTLLSANSNFDFGRYDTLQRKSAQQKKPKLVQELDEIAVLVMGSHYSGEDDSYHMLQALKYITSPAENHEAHKATCLSIKPFQTPNPEAHRVRGIKRFIKKSFGKKYRVKTRTDLLIEMGNINDYTPALLSLLRDQGYLKVKGLVRRTFFDKEVPDDWKGEFQGEDEILGRVNALFSHRDLENRTQDNYADIFSDLATRDVPKEIERNMDYRIGRPSDFGRGVQEFFHIPKDGLIPIEFAKLVFQKLAEIVSPEVLRVCKETTRNNIEQFKRGITDGVISGNNFKAFPYEVGDEVKDDTHFHTSTRISKKYVLNGANRLTLQPSCCTGQYDLKESDIKPEQSTINRVLNNIFEEVQREYEKNPSQSLKFIIDEDKEILYREERQKIGQFTKGTYLFLAPGRRFVVCGFEKEGRQQPPFDGLADLGKELLHGDDPKAATAKYFEPKPNMTYLQVIEFRDGKKVSDFEVRK